MSKVILTVGIPACGKSTWVLNYIQTNTNAVRLNRDDFRFMFKDTSYYKHTNLIKNLEKLITENNMNSIRFLVEKGINIVMDETNLDKHRLLLLIEFLNELNVDIEFKIFDIDIDVAIERDSKRGDRCVGEHIIRKFYEQRTQLINSIDFYEYGDVEVIMVD